MLHAEFVIREATAEDAAAIAHVHVASWRTTYRGIVDQHYIDQLSIAEFAARWETRLSSGDGPSKVLVACSPDGSVVGFASGDKTRDRSIDFGGELFAVYLLEEVQGHGLGRRLVHEIAADLLAQGHTSMCVYVLAENPARRFYEHLGAEFIRDEPHVVGGRSYPACWYGWRDLRALVDSTAI